MTGLLAGAFVAGIVATVNPCGFAMLPAYLGWFMGERRPGRRQALTVGLTVSAGFVLVFLVAGVLLTIGVRAVVDWIPWVALTIGLGLVVIGIAQLRGLSLYLRMPGLSRSSRSGSLGGLVGFGASYGAASLSCTLPIFLSLIAGAVAGTSFLQSASVFLAYGAGMSLVVVVLTLAVAVGRDTIVQKIRPLAARLGTISGWILILAGAFIVWYWATVLAAGATALNANPIARVVDRLTAQITGLVASNPLAALVVLGLVGTTAWLSIRRKRIPAAVERDQEEMVSDRD